MNFIAHRGNTRGPQPSFENTEDYLQDALDKGYHIEVDIQLYRGALYLGHDAPNIHVNEKFIKQSNVICHAKTFEAMGPLLTLGCHSFFHQEDDITLTSRAKIWCYPGKFAMHQDAIWLDLHNIPLPDDIPNIWGICGDNEKVMSKIKK
jgi:hypothetical protein